MIHPVAAFDDHRRAGGVSPPRDRIPPQKTKSRGGRRPSGGSRLPLAVAALLILAVSAPAQEILDVQVGFKPLSKNAPTHKVGFWTPVAIRLKGAAEESKCSLAVETDDSEDCAVVTRLDVTLQPHEEKTILVDVKPGRTRGDVHVTLSTAGRRTARTTVSSVAGELGDYLYLDLSGKIAALADALDFKEKRAAEEGKQIGRAVRFAVAQNAPSTPLGYDGIDLIFASGPVNADVLDWVKRGGRLVVGVDSERAREFAQRIHSPLVEPRPPFDAKNLVPIEAWSGLQNKPFPPRGELPIKIARLDPADFGFASWDVLVKLDDKSAGDRSLPLIARTSYGFGSITFIAFPLDSGAFTLWSGQQEFLRTVVDQIGPRYVSVEKTKETGWRSEAGVDDWGAQLQRDLDNFDVPIWSFGKVAFAMLGYLLLVSAGDYFILRRVFGRMETTWITLPLLVAGVSLAAYFAIDSPAERGDRVNQISLLDFDLRGGAGSNDASRMLYHGSTFFTLRSDRIRRYDVKIEDFADLDPWYGGEPTVSWFGRADDGPGGIGRAGGHGLATKSYESPIGHVSLVGVPLAFRATRSFTADCLPRTAVPRPDLEYARPLNAELVYHPRESLLKVSGTIWNDLPFDLEDASLFVFDRVYPLAVLKKKGSLPIAIKEFDSGILPSDWITQLDPNRPVTTYGRYDPGAALKNIMFHERLDPSLKVRNHLLRRLDWSWRLRDDPRVLNVPLSTLGVRDVILVGRAKFEAGDMSSLEKDSTPARIAIEAKDAKLSRDTYVRAIFPMRPQP